MLTEMSGWGRYPVVSGVERLSEDLEQATRDAVISRGLGRSYGDASLPPREGAAVACTRLADRVLRFDPDTGLLRAEAGLSLHRLNRLSLARGWSCPVVPGTQFVTLGGMVAADVHGKNQHRAGSFGDHVRSLRLRVADGRILDIDENREAELFRATVGGMGLTGHLLEVELQLERIPSPWIWQEVERVPDLDELIRRLRQAGAEWPFTVTWVDALERRGSFCRGVLIKGRWATPDEAPRRPPGEARSFAVPTTAPNWLLNGRLLRLFNSAYYARAGRSRSGPVSPGAFFYPLDAMRDWNRLYGSRGFTQYQCVLPDGDASTPRRFFEELLRHDESPFLVVVKDFGRRGRGLLSFPMPGVTIAVDLALRGEPTQRLVDALNERVVAAGGRVYLAKDALTRAEHFRAMERDRLTAWNAVRRRWDPAGRLASAQSVRLLGDAA